MKGQAHLLRLVDLRFTLNTRRDDMAEDRLTFKEMCAEFDVTPRTLRYYEYIELLQPDREGRARFYGPRELARMKLIFCWRTSASGC